jgi:putative heme transporter
VLNGAPLALFVPGLGVRRALTNDLSANLVATMGPPPADLVLRMAMFSRWGIGLSSATSGLTLNMLTYYVARFAAPILGFVIALVTVGYHSGYALSAVTSGAVAAAIVAGLVIVSRGERTAAAVGRLAGRAGHRVAPSRVDPDRWSAALMEFQTRSGERLRRSSGWAGLNLVGLLLVEGILLVLCLRFVGVPAAQVPAAEAVVVLLLSYPLTALPFAGLGVLDTAITVVLAEDENVDIAAVVAALVIWRVCLLLVPLLFGGLCLLVWRRRGAPATGDPAAVDVAGGPARG